MPWIPLPEGFAPPPAAGAAARIMPVALAYAVEAEAVAQAVPARRHGFGTGRMCARKALGSLGQEAVAIPIGPDRAPCWPEGFVGSVSHSPMLALAMVARSEDMGAIGVDIEGDGPLAEDLWTLIGSPEERRGATGASMKRLFSVKEAVFKAWFTAGGARILEFLDVAVHIDSAGSFVAETPPVAGLGRITGRIVHARGHVWSVAYP